jgi:hypothetical protein
MWRLRIQNSMWRLSRMILVSRRRLLRTRTILYTQPKANKMLDAAILG